MSEPAPTSGLPASGTPASEVVKDALNTDPQETPVEPAAESDEPSFNPAEYEQFFGLPTGSLSDAKDAEEVTKLIQEHTDKVLLAGLGRQQTSDPAPATSAPDEPVGDKDDPVLQRLAKLEEQLEAERTASQNRQSQEVDQRAFAEIDRWASPKYGSGEQRTYKQVKAVRELQSEYRTYIAGRAATGLPIPPIEAVLRSVRAFHDDTFSPSLPSTKPATAPLGTPGSGGKSGAATGEPRNIHEAVQNQWR